MRKLPYREGTWFAVPLEGGGFGVGLVARAAPKGKIIFAYFFGPKRTTVPTLAQVEGLQPQDAVLKLRVGDLGLVGGTWPVIGQSPSWQRPEWPMPVFVRREGSVVWLVHYGDNDPSHRVAMEPAPPQTAGLGRDSSFGFGAAEVVLTKALTEDRDGSTTRSGGSPWER